MSFSLLSDIKNDGPIKNRKKSSYSLASLILGVLALSVGVWLLTQLPVVSLWIETMVGTSVITWIIRAAFIVVGLILTIGLVKAFFSYIREEYDLGPTPICGFFLFGLIVALINHF